LHNYRSLSHPKYFTAEEFSCSPAVLTGVIIDTCFYGIKQCQHESFYYNNYIIPVQPLLPGLFCKTRIVKQKIDMQSQEKIIHGYNKVADDYAADRRDELSKKPLDQLLLKAFASAAKDKGAMADFGCGPGQTTKFLFEQGVRQLTGIDISPGMVNAARKLYPEIKFETGNLLNIAYKPGYFGSAIAFYAIVHFEPEQLRLAFQEINRVLKKGGLFLFSFHVGNKTVHFDKANDKQIDIDVIFFPTEKIVALLGETGFSIIDALERYPYPDVEWQTRRAYIWAERQGGVPNSHHMEKRLAV
jgi:SAM-dependent methyltransferase